MKTPKLPVQWSVLKLQCDAHGRGCFWDWWDSYATKREAVMGFRKHFADGERGTFRLVKVTCAEVARSGKARR